MIQNLEHFSPDLFQRSSGLYLYPKDMIITSYNGGEVNHE